MKQAKLFGQDEEPKVLTSLELAKAQTIASQVKNIIKPLCDKLEVVGSIRRQKATVGDVDFVAIATDGNWAKIAQTLKSLNLFARAKAS
jgi:DNA polymerase/3'-5' exonuclease PolX